MVTDSEQTLEEVETFVIWLGRAAALREVFPDYVLNDSSDYLTANAEIAQRRSGVLAIAERLNPSIARRISVCLDEQDDLEATAIACQRLFLILEPDGGTNC